MEKKIIQIISIVILCFILWVSVERADSKTKEITVHEETLHMKGIKKEYNLFLIGDSHISLCDKRDQSLIDKAQNRKQAFWNESHKSATGAFENLIQESNHRNVDLTIFAGDIIDSAMYASIDFVQEQFEQLTAPYLYILGNHDFEYGKEYFSKKAYQKYFPRLERLTGTKEQYCIKEFEEFTVVGINDSNNQLKKSAVKAVLPYIKKGKKPVILILHVPLQPLYQNSELEKKANEVWGVSSKGTCRVLIGETACVPNKTTKKLLNAVFSKNSNVAAVLAGHIHFYNSSLLKTDMTQYVTGAGYYGDAILLHLTP